MNAHLERAGLLYEQSRYALAEAELRKVLAAEPEHPGAHAMLGLCLAEQNKIAPALSEAKAAVGLAPDNAFVYYALAKIYYDAERYPAALRTLREAIRLDPEDVASFRLLAAIQIDREKWPSALKAAEKGLAIDPEDVGCGNLRAMVLNKLGRGKAVDRTLEAALRKEPENALTHANLGWVRLERGDHRRAQESFREALRLDPELDMARDGIIHALKARNAIYRMMLGYFFWMARLSPKARWAFIIGAYFGYRFIRVLAVQKPELGPILWPLVAAYVIFVLFTWIANPLFNLILRFDSFGRLALSRKQLAASNWFVACLAAGIAAGIGGAVAGNAALIVSAVALAFLVVPISGTFDAVKKKHFSILSAYTVALALLALFAVALSFIHQNAAMVFGLLVLVGTFFFTILANILR